MPGQKIRPPASSKSLGSSLSFINFKTKVKFYGICLKQDKILFTHGKTVNMYIVCKINLWKYVDSSDRTLTCYLFGTVTLGKNAVIDECKYSGYRVGFVMKGTFSFSTDAFGRNVIVLGADIGSSVHVEKTILVLGPTQGLNDKTLNVEKSIQLNLQGIITCCLSLNYNGAKNYLFVNGKEIHKFKAKDSKVNTIPLCLGNISKNVSLDNMESMDMFML